MYKTIAKQCSNCNLIVLLENFYKSKSGKFGKKSTCKFCEKQRRELNNKDPFNDKIWNVNNRPGENNVFISMDLSTKYVNLCRLKAYQLYIQYPEVNIDIISEILISGFELGNFAMTEAFSEEVLKEQYL